MICARSCVVLGVCKFFRSLMMQQIADQTQDAPNMTTSLFQVTTLKVGSSRTCVAICSSRDAMPQPPLRTSRKTAARRFSSSAAETAASFSALHRFRRRQQRLR